MSPTSPPRSISTWDGCQQIPNGHLAARNTFLELSRFVPIVYETSCSATDPPTRRYKT